MRGMTCGKVPLRVAVAICSVNRPDVLARGLPWLARQTVAPCDVLLVVTKPEDLPAENRIVSGLPVRVVYSPKGLTRQRNVAISQLQSRCDVVFFMDDDYIPTRFAVEVVSQVFAQIPQVNGVTGAILADGVTSGGIAEKTAAQLIAIAEQCRRPKALDVESRRLSGLYGCNMALRMSALGSCRFDENLPLYGWQEDVDFANRLPGDIVMSRALSGVHLGVTSGRETNGWALGYSQLANVVYLMGKGSLPYPQGLQLICRNLLANMVWSLRPEPWIDRRARLRGNRAAIGDLLRGTLNPDRILRIAGATRGAASR